MTNEFWKGKKVFITGYKGFIGSAIAKQLTLLGAEVKGTSSPHTYEEYLSMLHKTDVVYHIGARPLVGDAKKYPRIMFDANVRSTYNLLDACRALEIDRVVVASTDKVYGEGMDRKETDSLNGENLYDVSKIATDRIAQSFAKTFSMSISIARCCNIFGPGDNHPSRLIPGTIMSILGNVAPVIRSDGLGVRQYMYIQDAVNAYVKLGEHPTSGIFNFGSKTVRSTKEVVDTILMLTGTGLSPVVLNQAKDEIQAQSVSYEKAIKELKWEPEYSFETGLQHTIAYFNGAKNG